ncbi:AraC-type DNA-binding protein [Roseivivax halotolerans]|uniref:AraC-type DNA-binding protein n=1 Tax=Roseivivax halotolerans TaxID=93684 RepID=A0A1I6AA58_9RHOB|nr:AraC family transcriptional regulator [Roseivivax halotolerans]SFQ65500.1 AraC-type DNA-binding protein [Roseivivax halotolerans]
MIEKAEHLARTPNGGADPLSSVLSVVRVRGDRAAILAPTRPQSVLFPARAPCLHHVQRGEICIRVAAEDPVLLRANELALLLHGDAHRIDLNGGGVARDFDEFLGSAATPMEENFPETSTRSFWGSFSFDTDLAAKVLQPLPRIIVLTDLVQRPIDWLDLVCDLILQENAAGRPGSAVMVSRLLDLLLIQVLRRWAQSAETLPGWLAAARDDRIARVLAAIHKDPAQDWTNERLAALSGMSKSSFVARFRQVMGHQPGTYVRHWRLDRAAEAIQHSNATIDTVAATVGYASQEAFSRAFHSRFGTTPSAWRAAQRS